MNSFQRSRATCPLCHTPLANAGSHVRTPELDGPYGDSTFYCIPSGRHVTRRASWAEELRRSLERAGTRARRRPRGDRRAVGPAAAAVAWAFVVLVMLASWFAAKLLGGLAALLSTLLLVDFCAAAAAVVLTLLAGPKRPGPAYREYGRDPPP
jgi:hypothetical protein